MGVCGSKNLSALDAGLIKEDVVLNIIEKINNSKTIYKKFKVRNPEKILLYRFESNYENIFWNGLKSKWIYEDTILLPNNSVRLICKKLKQKKCSYKEPIELYYVYCEKVIHL